MVWYGTGWDGPNRFRGKVRKVQACPTAKEDHSPLSRSCFSGFWLLTFIHSPRFSRFCSLFHFYENVWNQMDESIPPDDTLAKRILQNPACKLSILRSKMVSGHMKGKILMDMEILQIIKIMHEVIHVASPSERQPQTPAYASTQKSKKSSGIYISSNDSEHNQYQKRCHRNMYRVTYRKDSCMKGFGKC